jgi:hypothetical protein
MLDWGGGEGGGASLAGSPMSKRPAKSEERKASRMLRGSGISGVSALFVGEESSSAMAMAARD